MALMVGISEDRRRELWDRAERMRMGFDAMRQSRAALKYIRAEATRRLPAAALEWFNPADYLIFESDRPALPVRRPNGVDARFTPIGA